MTAVVCGAILAAGVGLIVLHAWGLANLQERAGLRLCEMAEARRKREAAGAAENDSRCKSWMERRA
ncbi:MAG: hypothetical protein ACKVQA_25415 [Burkholderiales bacterium]